MNEIEYLQKELKEAVRSGDGEAIMEARAELASARAWRRREEQGYW